MKKIINDPKTLVADMAKGYAAAYGDIIKVIDNKFVCRATPKEKGKVGVIVANGVGHEPCMISLVGKGLLDVNVMGGIFAAPCGEDVAKGIELADRGAGVMVLVSGNDRLPSSRRRRHLRSAVVRRKFSADKAS